MSWAAVVVVAVAVVVSASFAAAVSSVPPFEAFECRQTSVEDPYFVKGLSVGLSRQWFDVVQLVGLGGWEGVGHAVLGTFDFPEGSFD